MLFKACVRCSGDLFIEDDGSDKDLICLQCGYRRTLRQLLAEKMSQEKRAEESYPRPRRSRSLVA
jgi:DNA-directed RNA polymerase subunit RPC12/RpoP